MPNAQSTVLQSRSISSPPVCGMMAIEVLPVGGVSVVPGVFSLTWTVNVLLPVLPCESVAVQVTVVSPSGKRNPEPGVQEATPGPSTASVVDGLVNVTTTLVLLLVSTVMSACGAIAGAVVS